MKTKTPKCTKAERHTWAFVRNVKVGTMTVSEHGSHGHLSLKGLYRCKCGATKHGAPDLNARSADLRGMVGNIVSVDESTVGNKPGCRVNGLVAPGAMCGKRLVNGGCGFDGECAYKEGGSV